MRSNFESDFDRDFKFNRKVFKVIFILASTFIVSVFALQIGAIFYGVTHTTEIKQTVIDTVKEISKAVHDGQKD